MLLLAALGLTLFAADHDGKRTAAPAFDVQALGAPQRALPAVDTPAFRATIGERGYTAGQGASAVSVSAVGRAGGWRHHAHGVIRSTAYGHETITLAANAVEQFSTVERHLGPKTWRWRLEGKTLEPRLREDGSVWFGGDAPTHILPVAIFDSAGRNVTPDGLRWSLRRDARSWLLELRLDDAELPLPYVIDPSSVSSATATATSLAAGAKANWTIGFTTGSPAGSALAAGSTITIAFPTWTGGTIPATPTVVLLSPASFATNCTATAATVTTTVTITLASAPGKTCALAKSTAATLEILGITNTTTTGAKTINVSTSGDTTPAAASPSPSIVAATSPSSVAFSSTTQAAAAVTPWTVGFTSSANGGLVGGSTVTAVFNAGFAVTGTPAITLGTGFSNCSATGATTAGPTVTVTLADSGGAGSCSFPAGTATTIGISGVTNASAATYANTSFTVKTSSDTSTASPGSGVQIAAQTTLSTASVTASNRAAAATSVTYTASFTPSAAVAGPPPTTGSLGAGSTITVALPAGTTVPPTPTITPTGGFSNCSLSSPGLSATVVVTLADSGGTCALAAGAAGTFTIAGITNTATGGSYTPTIKTNVDQTAASSASLVIFGTAAQLAFTTQPSGATGGSAFTTQPVVTVQDSGGRTVANNSSSVTVAIKAGTGTAGAALSGTATVSAVNGVATFSGLSIDKSGTSYQLHATDGVLTAADSSAFNVTVGTAAQLAFTQQPAGASGGSAFSTQPKVTVQDAGGNTVTSDSSTVTLTIGTNPAGGTLSGCGQSETNGVITFTGCQIDKAGTGYTLHATDGALTTTDSSSFNVTVGTAAQLAFTSDTSSVVSGSTKNLTAAVQDAGGNTLTSDNSTIVVFSQTAGAGSVTGLGTATASSGIASLTATGNVAGSVTIQAARQGGGLTTSTSTFSVTPGSISAATSTISASPSSITANGSSTTTVTVQAKDAVGNDLATGGSTIELTTTDGTFPSSCTTDCTATDNSDGTYTLTLTSSTTAHSVTLSGKVGVTAMTNSGSVTFAPGPISAATSTISASPSSITADGSSTTTVTVQAKDANGNNLTTGGSTIELTTTDGTFPSSCTTDCTATDNSDGTYTLTLTSSTTAHAVTLSGKVGVTAMTSTTGVTFTPGTATQLVFTTQPASATAGAAFGQQPVVKVEDANGNVVTTGGDSGVSITMSMGSGGGSLQGTTTVGAIGGVATFTNLRIDASGSHTVAAGTTLSIAGAVNGTSSSFAVAPVAATRLVVTGSAGQSAGGSQTITVTATDPYGNTDTSYTGNHTLVFSGANPSTNPATNPTVRDRLSIDQDLGNNTSLTFTTGQATATATLYKTETANLAAASTADSISASTGSDRLTTTVNPAAASKLVFTTQPGGTINGGTAFGTQPVLAVDDAYGNLVTGDSSSVTLAITNGTGAVGAALGGTTTVAAAGGSATFSGLSIDKAASGYTLTATDGALTSAVSSTFTVDVGPAAALAVSTQPAGATGGTAFSTQPVVDIVDAGGNLVTGDSSSVTIAIKAGTGTGGAVLSGTTTVSASGGHATFGGLSIDKSGTSYVLRATDGSLTAADSAAFDVNVGAAAKLAFTTSPAGATGGTAFGTQPVVAVQDAGGNTVTGDSSSLTLTIGTNPSSGTLTGCTPSESNGVFTLSGCKIDKVGNGYTLHATDGSLTAADSTSFNVATGAASAALSTVSANPTALPADGTSASTITVTLKDAGGNPVGGKTVTLGQGAGSSSISAASGPSDSSGVVTFTATDTTTENVTYTATDSTDSTTITQTAVVSFSSIDAGNSSVGASPSSVVADGSTTSTITVTVKDGNDNPVAGKTVTLAQGAGSSTISAASGPSNASGIVTFTVKSTVAEQVTYTATAAGVTITQTAQVTFTPDAADHLTFTSSNADVVSGSTKTLTVQVRDVNGNLETGDSSTVVTFAKTAGAGTVTGLGTATASGGIASLTVTGQTVGAVTVTASKTGLTSDTSAFSVTVGAADHLSFTSSGANVGSGATKTLTAEVRDAAGNLETGDSSTVVTFAKTAGAGTVTGLGTATASGGVASLTVTGQTAGAITITASKSGLTSDTSSFSVTVGAADHLTVTSDTSSVASGATKTLTAEIRDAAGNLDTGDSSTVVTFAKTAGAGTVTGLGTATASGGIATLTVTGQTAGAITITASKTGLTSDASSFSVTVGPADHLTFTSDASSVTSGATKTLTAEIRDAAGNLETGDSSTVVTFAKTAGTGTVTGLGTATASSGIASITVTGEAAGAITITASKTGLTSDASAFSVTVGPADHLAFTSGASPVASGSTKTLTAEIRDAAGNLETGDNSTVVTFAKTAGAGTVTGLGTATATGGVASLTVTGQTAGAITITAAKTGLTSDSSAFTVTVGPADHLTVTSDTASVTSGATKTLTAEVRDAAGNLETGDSSTVVTFAKTAGTGTVTGLGTATASGGIAGLTVTGQTAGALTVTASKAGLTPDTSGFTVTSGAIDAGVSTVVAASGTTSTDAGNTNTITVTVKDAFGNAVASSPVTLTQGAGHSAIAPSLDAGATGSATTDASGVATFTVSDGTVEGVVYSATASGTPITQTAGVTYTAGTPAKLVFGQQPSNVGVAQSIVPAVTVQVLDAQDNLAGSSGAGISLAINANPGGGTLTGGGSVSASGGIATFSGLSIDQVGNGYTLDATSAGLTTATSNPFNVLVAPGLTISNTTGSVVLDSGNTHRVIFRSGGSGSFQLTATPSGQPSYSFPTISGWTGVQGTGANLNEITYSYAGVASGGTGYPVTYNDGSGDSGPTLFDVADDSTKPAGGSISAPASVSAASVALTTTNFTDADAGIAGNVITRSSGQAPSGGVCPAGGYAGATVVTSPDTGVVSGNCYVYTLTGTDKVGNADSSTSSPVLVDTSAPSDPVFVSISGVGTSQYYTGSGTTIYFTPGAGNTNQFTLTASSTDAQSGVTYTFPHIDGFSETPGANPGEERYVASNPTTGDGGTGTVTATNGVGTASAGGFSFTIVVDGTGPAGGPFTSPSTDSYSTDGNGNVSWNAFTDADSGMSTLTIRRQVTTLAANACDAPSFADDATFAVTLTTASTSIPAETGLTSGQCFRYVTTATDHLGNVTTRTSSALLVDTTAPAAPTLTTLTKSGANVFVSGSTVFFKPGADATNTFTASAATTGDAETGVDSASWAFAGIPGFSAAAPAGSATETYTASTPTALQGGNGSATVRNNAGLTSAAGAAFSVVADNTAPTGGSFSGVPQYSGNGNVSFSMTLFGDGTGSGLATQTVQRQFASPTGSTCPAAGWTNDGAPTAPAASFSATGLANGMCYRWLFDAADNVGNAATTVIGGPTLVDTSGPSAPALVIDNAANAYVNGSTVYYDPGTGGSFRVTATSTASSSGIGSYTFNESTLASHGFTRGGTGNQAIFSFNVGASDAVGTVTATGNSGVTSPGTNFSLVGDATGPANPSLTCSPAPCTSNSGVSIDLTANGDGTGSGVKEIRYTIDGSDPTAASTLYGGTFSIGTSAVVKAAVIDNLGHVGAVTTQAITVDATPPNPTSTDVSGTSMNLHFDKLLVPSEVPATSAFAVSVTTGGTPVADNVTNVAISGATVTLTLATAVTNAQTAAVAYTKPGTNQLQDSFANYVANFTQTATLDVTAPAALSAAASGTTFSLQFDEPLDGTSVPAASAFAVTMTAGGSPTANAVTGAAVSGSTVTLTLGTAVTGYQSTSVAYTQPATNRLGDLAGNETAAFTKTVTLDTTAPHATTAEVNGNSLIVHFDETLANSVPAGSAFAVSLGGLSVAVSGVSVSGSDVNLTLAAAATGGQSVSLTYTPPASNKLQDGAANATASFTLSPTNMTSGGAGVVPTLMSSTPADGTTQATVSGPIALGANEYVAWSNVGITYVNFAGDAGTWQAVPGATAQTLSIPYTASAPGLYTVHGTISDGVTSTSFATHFTVWSASSGELPRPTAKTAEPGASGSLTTADQKETVSWPASIVPTTPGDGLVVQMAPQNPATTTPPAGTTWSAGGAPVDITIHTMVADVAVTTFSDPLQITFPNAAPTDIPIASTDGGATWRFVTPCDSPGVMPDGAKDCYAFSSGVLTVWTLHLTLFALASDRQPPTAPQKLGVGINGGQIVMRWEPATDNSGVVQTYTIFVDGQPVKVLGGKTYEYYVGPASAGDTHVYRVQATDGSGNAGPLSEAYTGVPDLRGLSQSQARDVLGSRGFTVGTIANAGSGGGVASQNPAAPGYAQVGSAVSFSLSTAVRTPLAMHVVGTRRLNLATRNYAAVRVQVNLGATIDAALRRDGHNVATWSRTVKAGTWILRYALPAGLEPGDYKLNVSARTATDRRAATIRVRLKHGQVLIGGKARVLVVGGALRGNTFALRVPKAKVTVTTEPKVWDMTFWSRNVAVVVVDVDRQGLALVHNLHTVFPSVRIVAVTKKPAKVVQARRYGASAVVLAGPATSRLVSATVSALLGRV